jgi:tRNA threonylcarbamoyladenosine biosynthesis protein TsaE
MHVDTIRIQLNNLEDTEKLGKLLGSFAAAGDVICLDGDLGAGKTALSQAIARGLGVPDTCYVTSPSFAILHEYEGRLPMYHMDFYRLQDAGEVEDLGFDEYFYLTGLTVIEWSNRAIELLPNERIILVIVQNDDLSRTVTLKGTRRYSEMIQRISGEFEDRAV